MPPTLRTLGYRAFHHCSGLEEIGLPAGLERIGTQAFARCPRLKEPEAGGLPQDLPPQLVRFLGKTRLDDQHAREEALHRLFNHELQAGFGLLQRYFLHLWD